MAFLASTVKRGCGLKHALDDGRVSPGSGVRHNLRVSERLLSAPIHYLKPQMLRQVNVHQLSVQSLERRK